MQKLHNNQNTSSYRPDVLVRGRGVGWNEKGYWYRQTGDDNNSVPISVRLRPMGWSKHYEYEITFGGREEIVDLQTTQWNDILTLKVNRLDSRGKKISSRRIYQSAYEPHNLHCPLCRSTIQWNRETDMWRCSVNTCTFNYTPETCTNMYTNWVDEDFGERVIDENHSHYVGSARNYFDRSALHSLQQKGKKELLFKTYNE